MVTRAPEPERQSGRGPAGLEPGQVLSLGALRGLTIGQNHGDRR